MGKMSPTQRTRKVLKEQGHLSAITERWNPYARIRQDLFGFIDLIYLDLELSRIVAVQVTSASNHAARRKKLEELDAVDQWRAAGGDVQIRSWRKNAAGRWVERVEEL